MSDHIKHDGKKYFTEEYLILANNTAERRGERIAELEAENSRLKEQLVQANKALIKAAVPLEVLTGQIAHHPYKEITLDLQQQIVDDVIPTVRGALAGSTVPPNNDAEIARLAREYVAALGQKPPVVKVLDASLDALIAAVEQEGR